MSDYRKLHQRMMAVHSKRVVPIDGYPADHAYCVEDRQTWPCATVAAIEELDREREQYEQENAAAEAERF